MSNRKQNVLAAIAVVAIAAISSLPRLMETPAPAQTQMVAEAAPLTAVSFNR